MSKVDDFMDEINLTVPNIPGGVMIAKKKEAAVKVSLKVAGKTVSHIHIMRDYIVRRADDPKALAIMTGKSLCSRYRELLEVQGEKM